MVVLVEINGKITVIIAFIVVILHPDFEEQRGEQSEVRQAKSLISLFCSDF